MSNPTLLLSQFSGSLDYTAPSGSGVWTGVAPIRYDSGLWVEQAGTNLVQNPALEVNTGGCANWGTGVITQVTSEHHTGVGALQIVNGSSGGGNGMGYNYAGGIGVSASTVYTVSAFAKGPGGNARIGIQCFTGGGGATGGRTYGTPAACPADWDDDPLFCTFTTEADAAKIQFYIENDAAVTWFVDDMQLEVGPTATSRINGTLGSGYAWTGGAHDSASTRAASSASVTTAGHLNMLDGGFAIKSFRRKLDTGSTEVLMEVGTSGSGTDRLRMYINSSDKLVMEWVSDGAAATTITSAASIAVNTDYFIYADWKDTLVRLRLDAVMATGTRNTPEGSWGAGALTLKAT